MKAITIHNFRSLLAGYEPPCVSVYMTTDPHRPGGAGTDAQRVARGGHQPVLSRLTTR
jgi:hypothetical protein